MMGTPIEQRRNRNECFHKVFITQPFYLAKYETTQPQWEQTVNNTALGTEKVPIENVCWHDCQDFLVKLCNMENLPEGTFTLPTEAEWEYACRAGTQTAFCFGNILLKSEANYSKRFYGVCKPKDSSGMTTVVGSFPPNAFGLYDMHGNISEWCNDRDWDTGTGTHPCKNIRDAKDPKGASNGNKRVIKGGDWHDYMTACRSASRHSDTPYGESSKRGFRIMLPIINN
jgi:formylglycine-generating enzyme required for sulfatase activity